MTVGGRGLGHGKEAPPGGARGKGQGAARVVPRPVAQVTRGLARVAPSGWPRGAGGVQGAGAVRGSGA